MDEQKDKSIQDLKDDMVGESVSKVIWIVVPIAIGGLISMFSNFEPEIQVVIWCLMIVIAGFGMWTSNAKKLRKAREKKDITRQLEQDAKENERWDKLDDSLTKIDKHFDKIETKIDVQEKKQSEVNKNILRNELVRMHREWVEEKGYITLEAHEYAEKTFNAYCEFEDNKNTSSGLKLWEDINNLRIEEHR